MSIKEGLKHGRLFSNIPHRLEIDGRPELSVFPFNVLFTQFGMRNEKRVMGNALYEPVIGSYKFDGTSMHMDYYSAYGGDSYLAIKFNACTKEYVGEKFVNGKSAGVGYGKDNWNLFFIHFTAMGLTSGERCEFTEV